MNLLIGCALSLVVGFGLGYWRGVVRGRAEGILQAAGMLFDRCSETAKEIGITAEHIAERLKGYHK